MQANNVKTFLSLITSMTPASYQGINGHKSVPHFLLQHGRPFLPRPLPGRYKRGVSKQCFMNAAHLALAHPTLTYCEGYAMGVLPVYHAWACDYLGRVIEVTWKTPGVEYFGIPIRSYYLLTRLRVQKTYGLIDQWEERWPMLQDPPAKWLKKIQLA